MPSSVIHCLLRWWLAPPRASAQPRSQPRGSRSRLDTIFLCTAVLDIPQSGKDYSNQCLYHLTFPLCFPNTAQAVIAPSKVDKTDKGCEIAEQVMENRSLLSPPSRLLSFQLDQSSDLSHAQLRGLQRQASEGVRASTCWGGSGQDHPSSSSDLCCVEEIVPENTRSKILSLGQTSQLNRRSY